MHALTASDLRLALEAALEALRANRATLDDLNVYPVPDGDTGTNLLLTFGSVVEAAGEAKEDSAELAHAIRSGALMGARGNSGVIASQILRAWADAVEAGPADPEVVARAFKRAVELAYEAVLHPAEGTILTALRAASEGAQTGTTSVAERFAAAARAAVEAVRRTPEQMELLARSGVVDAGAAGLAIVLGAMAGALGAPVVVEIARPEPHVARDPFACGDPPSFAYEVMYALASDDDRIPALRALLGTIGDSVAVVGGDGAWRVHVHTDEPQRAVTFGDAIGTTSGLSVTAFAEQITPGRRGVTLEHAERDASLVVIVDGDGNARMFADLGAIVVGKTLDLPGAIARAPAARVIVLPCSDTARHAALSVADAVSKTLLVLEVVEPAAALTIAAAYGEARPVDECVRDMEDARARLRVASAGTSDEVVTIVAGAVEGGAELVTILAGSSVPDEERDALTVAMRADHGDAVEVYDGGQLHPRYSVAVE